MRRAGWVGDVLSEPRLFSSQTCFRAKRGKKLTQMLASLLREEVRSTGSAPAGSSRLAVSERLGLVAVASGPAIDFYDLELVSPQPGLRSCQFLGRHPSSNRPLESDACELAFDPHDSGLLVAGTCSSAVVLMRLRRLAPAQLDQPGTVMAQRTLSKELAPADGAAVEALRFHPSQPGVFAAVCAGRVFLLQHGPGILASAEVCAAGPARSVEWCGDLLARGGANGRVTVWSVHANLLDPSSPALQLAASSDLVCELAPPRAASDAATPAAAAVTALRWVRLASVGAGAASSTAVGMLCCAHANALLRTWSFTADGQVALASQLPSPVGSLVGTITEALEVADGGAEAEAEAGGEGATPFRAAGMRHLLCGAPAGDTVFALPFGREAEAPDSSLRVPTPVELLRAPALDLGPHRRGGAAAPLDLNDDLDEELNKDPADGPVGEVVPGCEGTRGMHRLEGLQWKRSVLAALAPADADAPDPSSCELLLLLTDRALRVVAFGGGARGAAGKPAPTRVAPPPQARAQPAPEPAPLPTLKLKPPLVSHLVPAAPRREGSAAAAAAAVAAKAAAKAAAAPTGEVAALHARIHALEERSRFAERQLTELRASFALYAATSRKQTNGLLAALETLEAERAAGGQSGTASPAVEGASQSV